MDNLRILKFEDSGCKIVYCPELDIAGYGKTYTEAEKSFCITLEETVRYIAEYTSQNQ